MTVPRCVARLTIDADQLVGLLRRTVSERVRFEGIPDDAVVVGMAPTGGFNRVTIYLESASFPAVVLPNGIPELACLVKVGEAPLWPVNETYGEAP
jgi:hypothetical protein